MKTKAYVAVVAAVFGGFVWGEPVTDLLFFYDTEAFTARDAAQGVLEIANIMSEEGVTATFALVGKMAEALDRWGRQDVLKAMARHEIATHTWGHTYHPTTTEMADVADYDLAYRTIRAQEEEAVAMLKKYVPGLKDVVSFVPPGNNEPYVAQYIYRDLGMKFTCGGSYCPNERGDQWYCGMLQIPYVCTFEDFLPGHRPCDPEKFAAQLAKAKRAVIYCHPQKVIDKEFWDILNFNGKNPPEGEPYRQAEKWTPAETAQYLDGIRKVTRYLKNDPRFRIVTPSQLAAEQKPRERMRLADVTFLRDELKRDFGPIDRSGWCLCDVFRGAVLFLRGETCYDPSREFGFLEKPVGVTSPCVVTAADMKAAAAKIDLGGFLPSAIDVGGMRLGPRDFLMAALEILATGAPTAKVEPIADQLGSFRAMPRLEKTVYTRKSWCVYSFDLKDDYVSDRLRLQLWTLRNDR